MKRQINVYAVFLLLCHCTTYGWDNLHFYLASSFLASRALNAKGFQALMHALEQVQPRHLATVAHARIVYSIYSAHK